MNRRFALVVLLAAVTLTAFPMTAADAPLTPPKFIVGVWYQPIASFAKWKSRGINTLVGCELEGGNTTREQWCKAARDAGLFYIIRPGDAAQRKAEAADPYLLAWEQQDEPDGAGNVTPEEIVKRYAEMKQSGDKPVFVNFDGWKMQWRPAADYERYVLGGDILALDYYVINRGEGADSINKIGDRLDRLTNWTDGKKKLLVFIECSDQNLRVQEWTQNPDASGTAPGPRMRCPSADEIKAEVKMALDHGATGLVYFPQAIGRNFESFDATPQALVPVITAINQSVTGVVAPARTDAPTAAKTDAPATATPGATPPASTPPKRITIDGKTYILVPVPD